MPGWQQEGGSDGGIGVKTIVQHPRSLFLYAFVHRGVRSSHYSWESGTVLG